MNPIASLFFNQTPSLTWTANPGQASNGTVTGTLTGTDGDGNFLTYSVSSTPAHGSATVNPDGSYTYTPDPDFLPTGTTDSFVATVSDASSGFHIHGLGGLLNLLTFGLLGESGHTATTTVAVTVAPAGTTTTVNVGTRPLGIAVSPATGRVYVANYGSNNISVLDAATNTVTKTIALTQIPDCLRCGPWSLAVTPNGSQLYATDSGSVRDPSAPAGFPSYMPRYTISVINIATDAVSSVALNSDEISLAVSPDGQTIYAGPPGWPTPVSVVNTANNQLSKELTSAGMSLSLAISPDGRKLYVNATDKLWLTDVTTNQPEWIYNNPGASFEAIALSPDGGSLYVAENLYSAKSRYVRVIDTATKVVKGTIRLTTPTNDTPEGWLSSWSTVAISPDGSRLYVLNPTSGTMDVIDTASQTVVITVPVGASPFAVAVSPDGKSIYVTNQSANTLTIISA